MPDSIYMVHYQNLKTIGTTRSFAEELFIGRFGKETFDKATVSEYVFNQHISGPVDYVFYQQSTTKAHKQSI